MAQIYPFRALRYDTSKVDLADVVTQPYDKISPEMQERYYALSPYNLIRIILGKKQPRDNDADNVYTRAAATLDAWRAEGVLREDAEPALFGYAQTYTVPGTGDVRTRRGFIGLGQLYDYDRKVVFRHEQTFPKHKSDRLALFKATRAYCEQIYMLYSDPAFVTEELIFGSKNGEAHAADIEVTDEYGVQHRVWKITDPATLASIVDAMHDKPLIIADGHHRYETSVTYMHERAKELGIDEKKVLPQTLSSRPESQLHRDAAERPAVGSSSALASPPFPEAAMMMTFVNMDAPGITILPTHRVVFGLPDFSGREFAAAATEFFTVAEVPHTADGHFPGPDALLKRLNEVKGTAFIAATRDGDFLLTPLRGKMESVLQSVTPRQRDLDVTQLHKLVLEKLLGLNEDTVRAGTNVRYVREAADALAQVGSGNADVAFLIKPVTLEQMADVSLNGEVMPQKSTDFYPKLLSGLAMYALD